MRLQTFSAVAVGKEEAKLVLVGPYTAEVVDVVMTVQQARQLAAHLSRVADREEVIQEPEGEGIGYFLRVKGFCAPTVADLEQQVNAWLSERGAVWVHDIRFVPGEREYVAWVVQEVENSEAGA